MIKTALLWIAAVEIVMGMGFVAAAEMIGPEDIWFRSIVQVGALGIVLVLLLKTIPDITKSWKESSVESTKTFAEAVKSVNSETKECLSVISKENKDSLKTISSENETSLRDFRTKMDSWERTRHEDSKELSDAINRLRVHCHRVVKEDESAEGI